MKINRHQTRFTSGEYSRAAITRVDLDKTLIAAETQENLVPSLSGDVQVRPGTEYIDTTLDNAQARLIPFIRDTADFALIEMTAGKIRIMVDDTFITRPTVTSTIVNPNFDLATGWTTSTTGNEITQGASYANLQSGPLNNQLRLQATAQGSKAFAVQSVTIPSEELGTAHALRIDIERGPVLFRIGSTSGGQDVVEEQILQAGEHSLAFTPTAAIASTYYIWLGTRFETEGVVNSIQFESNEIMELAAPWTQAQLREVSFDQAADVIFFAHESWQPRRLERRGTTSWSMVKFDTDGGPTQVVSDGTTLKVNSTRNSATITTSRDYFTPDMVGTVVRAYHDELNASFLLAGAGEFTEPWRVTGIVGKKNNDRLFRYQILGGAFYGTPGTPPFDGTITMQRSISGEDGDYLDHPRDDGTLTSFNQGSGLVTFNGKEEDANLVAFHRLGFKKDADYTEGFAEIQISYVNSGGFGWGRIIEYYSPRQVLIAINDKFHATGQAAIWNLGTWGTFQPWPSCVALSDNRLWFGGNARIWGSALNSFSDFDDIDTSALRSLTRTLGSGGASSSARWFLPLQRLIAGTEGAQVSIRAGAFDEGVTAENITLKDCATIGANYVSPIKLDSRGVFVHSSGSDVYVLKPGAGDYEAERLTVYNDEILDEGVVELAAQRQPETMVWCVRSDGQVPVIMYEFDDDLDTKTWWRFVTAGDVESVAVLPGSTEDRVYMVVNRTPDPDDENITGAEELAPSGVDVFSADLTDQSVLVVDSGTPANDLNTDERFDEWGNIVGLETIVAQNTSDLKLTMQSSGYLGYQPHNLAPSSYDFTVSGFTTTLGATIGTAPNTTYPAPDGVGVMQKIIPPPGVLGGGIQFDVNVPGAGEDSARILAEISFYTKYEKGEGDVFDTWNIFAGPYLCSYIMDELVDGLEDIYLGPAYDNTDALLGFSSYLDDRVLSYSGEPAPSDLAFDQPAISYLDGSTEYLRLRWRFYLVNPETTITIRPAGGTADGFRGGYIWGLQCNLLPTAEQLAGGYSQLIQHNSNAPRILLPYEWDNAGALEGIRTEPAGDNLLASGTDFTASDFTPTNILVNYAGSDSSPNGLGQGTQLLESDVQRMSGQIFLNPNFEEYVEGETFESPTSGSLEGSLAGSIPGWTFEGGTSWVHISAGGYSGLRPQKGSFFVLGGSGNPAELRQDSAITAFVTASDIDEGRILFDASVWLARPFTGPTLSAVFEARNAGGDVISTLFDTGSVGTELGFDSWTQYESKFIPVPALTRTISCRLLANSYTTYNYGSFDNIETALYRQADSGVARVHKLSHPIFGIDGQYCASTYVYPGELTYLALRLSGNDGESFLVNFNVDTGVINLESAVGVSNAEAGVEALPFGCYRIWITGELAVTPDDGVLTSNNVTTASFISAGEPTITSTGTSTVTWGVEGIEVGTTNMAGTTSPDLKGDFVLDNNLVVNGNFDGGTFYGWDGGIGPTGEIVTTSPPGAYEGNFYLTPSSSGVFVSQYIDLTQAFTAAELDSGTAQLDMGMAAIKLFADTSAAATMAGQWYADPFPTYISNFTAINNNSLPLDTWTELSTTVTIPATARTMRLYVYDSGSTPDSHSFDAIYVRKAGTPAVYEPTLTVSGTSAVSWGNSAPGPLFTNIDFEADTPTRNPQAITGWTPSDPSDQWELWDLAGTSHYPAGCEGNNRCFSHRDSGTGEFWLEQIGGVVTAGYTAEQIDAGKVYFQASGAMGSDISTPDSRGKVVIEFLDNSQTLISTGNDTGYITPPGTSTGWTQWEMENTQLPSGCRYIRWRLYAEINNTGTYNHIAFDGQQYQLTGDISEFELFKNNSFEAGAPSTTSGTSTTTNVPFYGWTLEQGTNVSYFRGTVDGLSAHTGTRWIQGANQATTEYRQDIDLTTEVNMVSTAYIDAGYAKMSVSVQMANTFATDTGQVIFDFRDSGGTIISTAYDTGAQEITPLATWQEFSSSDIAVPANTRIISVRLIAVRLLGTYANTNFDSVSAVITIEGIGDLSSEGSSTATWSGVGYNTVGTIVDGGTASASFAGASTELASMTSSGSSTVSWDAFPDYPVIAAGTSSVSWGIPPITMTSAGVTTASFGPPASAGIVTMAGSTSLLWGAAEDATPRATFSIILSDVNDQTVTSQNELSFAAQSSRGVVVWGAQFEYNRSRPSSFVSRTATSLRAADAYTIDNSKLPISDTTMSMFAEIKRNHLEAGTILSVVDGSDALSFELDSSGQSLHRVTDNGGDVATITDGVAAENTQVRLASSAQVDDAKFVVDGGSALTDTSLTMPAVSGGTTFIGSGYDGIISRIMILPQASTEAELQGYGVPQDPPTYRYIEKLALKSEAIGGSTNKMADSGAFFAGPASTVTCAWLVERSDIVAWATNASGIAVPLTGLTSDVDGNIALGDTYTNIWIGLGYTARYRSAKLAFQNFGGTALLQRKRIAELGVLLQNTHRDAIRFGEDFTRMRNMNLVKAGKIQSAGTIYSTYDDKSFSFPGSWDTDSRLCIEIQAPYPANLLGLVIGLEWNERGLG